MADTLFIELKLKRGRHPLEVFEKMAKAIKKKGATKNWTYKIDRDNHTFLIDFGDEKSETFFLEFNKQVANVCCKVDFPLEGELYEDDKKSEFKILLNMIYSARTSFSVLKIHDDYGLAEDFMESKEFKLKLRELTDEEFNRAKRVYEAGYTTHTDFALKLIYDYLDIAYEEDYEKYINKQVLYTRFELEQNEFLPVFIEKFLYETSEYKDRGRLYLDYDYYDDLNGLWFSVHAFIKIMHQLIKYKNYPYDNGIGFGVKHGQILKYYKKKYLPQIESDINSFEKCVLTYRFFVSVYDFCGFKYVGKNKLLIDYENNLGKVVGPRCRFYNIYETKLFFTQEYLDVIKGHKLYATVGVASYGKCFKDCEIVMVTDSISEEVRNIFGKTIVVLSKKNENTEKMMCLGIDSLDVFIPGFSQQHNKSAIYFTATEDLIKGIPKATSIYKIYTAFFITREECMFINEYGYEKFEEEIKNREVDVRALDRDSMC